MIDEEWPALAAAFLKWLDPQNFDEMRKQRTSLSVMTGSLIKQRG